jgi:hypothetical protein
VGRLEDIVERNQNPKRFGERITVGIGFGVFLLIILALMVFTDLGKRPAEAPPPPSRDHHVDDIKLGRPYVRPASAAPAH